VRVFNLNKAMGFASSGVEYAQAYRRDLLAGIPWVDDRWVFTDFMQTNPCVFADRLGFERERVLWVYNLLMGRELRPSTMSVQSFLAQIWQAHKVTRLSPEHTEVTIDGTTVRYRIRSHPRPFVDRVETYIDGQLSQISHYDATLSTIEHFVAGQLQRRTFYTPDARVAAEQFYLGPDIVRTVVTPASPMYPASRRLHANRPSPFLGDVVLEGRAQFLRFVFDWLFDRPDDVVIVDRALDVMDAVYPVIGSRRLYSVVHAEHYDLKQWRDGVLLWNNHYEHVFTRLEMLDGLIVSTERQREMLAMQLATTAREVTVPVICIPVGYASETVEPPERQRSGRRSRQSAERRVHEPLTLVTASRLADEKHIDTLIRAVARARETLPGLRLDVYGEGKRERLMEVRAEQGADDCVRFMGHHNLDGILRHYALYVSASWSEGFGLSLLEAMSAGLPIVGFDVEYGNREFVTEGVNGRLVPHVNEERDVAALAEAIVGVLTSPAYDEMRAQSVRKAATYAEPAVRLRWAQLLQEDSC